jgi:hypothetical protein
MIGGTYWYVLIQTTLQFSFFMAQWEEYHTHVLPHCAGKWLGVTEVNYGMAVMTIINSFLDREAVYHRSMGEVLAPFDSYFAVSEQLPALVLDLELRYFLAAGWAVMNVILQILSLKRVLFHPHIASGEFSTAEIRERRFNAISKLATPLALGVAAFLVPPDAVRTRYLSVTLGLAYSLLTKKMIVFSMAKMAFSVMQWDAVPFLLAALWIRFDDRLTKMGADFVLGLLCFWYTFRMLRWVNITINQICGRLDIYCFRLKKRKRA